MDSACRRTQSRACAVLAPPAVRGPGSHVRHTVDPTHWVVGGEFFFLPPFHTRPSRRPPHGMSVIMPDAQAGGSYSGPCIALV